MEWFLTFITLCKSFRPLNFIFVGQHFHIFSADSKSASNFAFYDTELEMQKRFFHFESNSALKDPVLSKKA
jgi:hypothetical protein